MSLHNYILLLLCVSMLSLVACKDNSGTVQELEIDQTTGLPEIDGLTKKIEKDPQNADLLFARSQAYADVEAYDNAIADMYGAMRVDSMRPKFYVHLADVFMNYYRSSQAYEIMRLASERFPQNLNILLRYAELSITLKQNQKAVQTIQQILELDNENAQAYFLMGLLMQEEKDFNRAKAAFKRVVEIDPEVIDAYILLGELYEKDDKKLARQYLDNAITVAPNDINALHSKAFFLQNNDQIQEAIDLYKQINTIAPNYAPAFLNAGILHMELEENKLAYEQFNILTRIEPANHIGFFFRGLASKELNNIEQAKSDFQQALNLKADYQKAKDELAKLK